MKNVPFACLVFLLSATISHAQPNTVCINGVCTPPVSATGEIVAPVGAKTFNSDDGSTWYFLAGSPEYVYCTKPVAFVYDYGKRKFARFNRRANKFEPWEDSTPPVAIYKPAIDEASKLVEMPPMPHNANPPLANSNNPDCFGVDLSKLKEKAYSFAGKPVSKNVVFEAMDNALRDESTKKRITIIGPTDLRAKAISMLPSDVDTWAIVKAYAPDDWHVKNAGFLTDGSPVVYIQEPDGTVIHRQDDLNNLQSAVNRANPKYNPANDPDLRTGLGIIAGGWQPVVFGALIGAAAVFVIPYVFGAIKRRYDERQRVQQEMRNQQLLMFDAMNRMIEFTQGGTVANNNIPAQPVRQNRVATPQTNRGVPPQRQPVQPPPTPETPEG